jgi:Tol biopolymer transport system component
MTVLTMVVAAAVTIPALATFPGKNGRIAFVFGPDIYTMNPDGSDLFQITNLPPTDTPSWFPDYSPDGKRIVFCHDMTERSSSTPSTPMGLVKQLTSTQRVP